MNKLFRSVFFYMLIVVVAVMAVDYYTTKQDKAVSTDYSTFIQQVNDGKVHRVTIVENTIRYNLKDQAQEYTTYAPRDYDLIDILKKKEVVIRAEPPPPTPWWMTLFSSALPFLILIAIWFFMMNNAPGSGGKVMNFGRSRARLHDEKSREKVTFADVAGCDEAKEELAEIVEFLKQPKKFVDLGARIPKGVLLFGAPGTGKTLLAKAVAGEAGVPFFSISGSDFVEMFVGVGASRVRDLFDQAKKNAPCIIFIDEIDAVGRQRGAGLGGGHDEREQTLNQLLVEMDGFGVNEGIIIIAATNRPDILDPALLRPGRFDRNVVVDRPDIKGRRAILDVHVRGKPLATDVSLDVLARRTPGFTGADLSNLVNEAALLAARRNHPAINMQEMEEAIERVVAGPERRSRVISDNERRLTAYHEAGHALIGMLLPQTDPVHKVSIIPRGRAGGYTLMLPKEDKSYATRSELLDQIKTLLGGRVAEQLVLDEISTGAQNDLERSTALARKMITEYGMSDKLGPVTFGKKQEQVFLGRDFTADRNYSEEVAQEIDGEIRRIIDEQYQKVRELLSQHIERLHAIAAALLERETLEAEELEMIMAGRELPPVGTVDVTVCDDGVVDNRTNSPGMPGDGRPEQTGESGGDNRNSAG
ncbi:MAG: ATP-dependent zinc metalloprotease FtsH [Negativicutes bacterium]|nr:ATP-dependent zinc metalloprotease FtsH [Negativicutes bacterium]